MSTKPVRVFLDANVVISMGKPPAGPLFDRLTDLVISGFIEIITIDLTVREIAKKHANNDFEIVKGIAHKRFRRLTEEITGIKLPDASPEALFDSLLNRYDLLVSGMFKQLQATRLTIDSVKPSSVFDSYAKRNGLFSGKAKKDQFPDAFILELLKTHAKATGSIVIISNDHDFSAASASSSSLETVNSIPKLFEMLGLKIEAPELDEFIEGASDELMEHFQSELNDWGLSVSDVQDAEIDEATITEIEVDELTAFSPADESGEIVAVGKATVTADVSYTHPDWDSAMWDSEDKVLIPFDNVSGETSVTVEVSFSISILIDKSGKPTEIEEVRFKNEGFLWVDITPSDIDLK